MGQIMAWYLLHEEPTRYGFLQAATWTFWHREKMTSTDFVNNDVFMTGLLEYAFERLT